MNQESTANPDHLDRLANKMTSDEAHEDLNEFNRTKDTVNALLDYKRSLIALGTNDAEKVNDIKQRAIEAINHLFEDIISTPKQKNA
jgi:hypothetical protein